MDDEQHENDKYSKKVGKLIVQLESTRAESNASREKCIENVGEALLRQKPLKGLNPFDLPLALALRFSRPSSH